MSLLATLCKKRTLPTGPDPFLAALKRGGFPDTVEKEDKADNVTYALLSTVENLQHLLNHFGIMVRYNEMLKLEQITMPVPAFRRAMHRLPPATTVSIRSTWDGCSARITVCTARSTRGPTGHQGLSLYLCQRRE